MKLLAVILVFFCFLQEAISEDAAQKGYRIAKELREANKKFRGEVASMELVLISAHGESVTRKMMGKALEVDGDGDKSLIVFLWPADVKGTKLLTWSHLSESDDQWLYLPALKRVKRINSSNKTGSFMGSEFSYEDIGSVEVDKYTYKFIKSEKKNNHEITIIERYPKDEDSGYKRQVVWSDMTYNQPIKVEYYDRKNELLKTAIMSKFKKYKKWWRANEVNIQNHQTKKKSQMIWKKRKLGVKFNELDFHQNKLK